MPTPLLIDRDGKIAELHVGMVDKEAFEADIQTLLKDSAKRAANLTSACLAAVACAACLQPEGHRYPKPLAGNPELRISQQPSVHSKFLNSFCLRISFGHVFRKQKHVGDVVLAIAGLEPIHIILVSEPHAFF